jgi:hypothetical protein
MSHLALTFNARLIVLSVASGFGIHARSLVEMAINVAGVWLHLLPSTVVKHALDLSKCKLAIRWRALWIAQYQRGPNGPSARSRAELVPKSAPAPSRLPTPMAANFAPYVLKSGHVTRRPALLTASYLLGLHGVLAARPAMLAPMSDLVCWLLLRPMVASSAQCFLLQNPATTVLALNIASLPPGMPGLSAARHVVEDHRHAAAASFPRQTTVAASAAS